MTATEIEYIDSFTPMLLQSSFNYLNAQKFVGFFFKKKIGLHTA